MASNIYSALSQLEVSSSDADEEAIQSHSDGDEAEELPARCEGADALRLVRRRSALVWIDMEMTGLDVEKDRVLEIACIVTDDKLDYMVMGPNLVINQSEECLAAMNEWCKEHHFASGLVEDVRKSRVSEKEAEKQVLKFVRKYTDSYRAQLAGNSVYNDLNFLKKYMPNLAKHFSFLLVDVSSVRALCRRWFPKEHDGAPVKSSKHRALDDIQESIKELKYFKKTIFRDLPQDS